MTTLTRINPYSDADMIWDEEERRYILTAKYVQKKCDFDPSQVYGGAEAMKKQFNKVSRYLYDFLYSESCKSNNFQGAKRNWLEFDFATNPRLRNFFKQALVRFSNVDEKTDGGLEAEDYGDSHIISNGLQSLLVSWGLIKMGYLRFEYQVDETMFSEGVDPNGK